MRNVKCFLFVCIVGMPNAAFASCNIKMAYKDVNKPPYIQQDNRGIFKALYSKAANMIGCELSISRKPKKRILLELESGAIDFYPQLTPTKLRSKTIQFMMNHFSFERVLVTREDVTEITNLQQIKNLDLIAIIEKGGYNPLDGITKRVHLASNLSTKKYFKLLLYKRGDVFLYGALNVNSYMNDNNIQGVKVHKNVFNQSISGTLGFSKKSKHINLIVNKQFQINKPITIHNQPFKVNKNSIAYKLSEALLKLKNDGFTEMLVKWPHEK